MGIKRRMVIAALLVGVLGALAWAAFLLSKSAEPDYQGRSLSAWLPDIDFDQSQAKRDRATEAIRSMGTNTLPFLLRDLDLAQYSRVKEYLIRLGRKQTLVKLSWRTIDERSRQATWAFKALGAIGAPAIPELLRLEESNPGYAPGALAGIGVVALPYLIQSLTNKNDWVRANAAIYLANAVSDGSIPKSEAKVALPRLMANLQDTNSDVRLNTTAAINSIGP